MHPLTRAARNTAAGDILRYDYTNVLKDIYATVCAAAKASFWMYWQLYDAILHIDGPAWKLQGGMAWGWVWCHDNEELSVDFLRALKISVSLELDFEIGDFSFKAFASCWKMQEDILAGMVQNLLFIVKPAVTDKVLSCIFPDYSHDLAAACKTRYHIDTSSRILTLT